MNRYRYRLSSVTMGELVSMTNALPEVIPMSIVRGCGFRERVVKWVSCGKVEDVGR